MNKKLIFIKAVKPLLFNKIILYAITIPSAANNSDGLLS